jgi:DNA-binding NtrC family response regulator
MIARMANVGRVPFHHRGERRRSRSEDHKERRIMSEKIQILFVDDEEEFVNYMKKRLERHEFQVHAYTNPVEALEKSKGQTYDVGLLDLKMPEMDGEELLNRLKERDPGIEIIILTGHGSIESAFRSAKEGAYEYLLKPCDFDSLVSSINNAYAKRIKSLSAEKARHVDELMQRSGGMKPLTLLKRLKRIRDGLETFVTAAGLADGDPEVAREFMEKRTEKDTE